MLGAMAEEDREEKKQTTFIFYMVNIQEKHLRHHSIFVDKSKFNT